MYYQAIEHFLGYMLHQQISKALQRRSEAIRKAITHYNTQAVALDPPRPKISWKQIASYTYDPRRV
jgi:metal-responsive CopG/Arc/MetJ family transcriptional regulator